MASTSEPEPGDPEEDDDPDRPDADEHHAAIRALLATFADWMRDRSRRIARRHDLDADDVFQLTWLRLLRSRMTADLTNDGIRTWLARRIHWAASELARQRRHDGGERIAADEVDALIAEADMQASRTASTAGSAVDAKLLDRIGLTRHQIHVVLSECSGLDLSLREYAHLVGRSYTAIRKDKERALDRIERWVGLNHEERRVFMAFRARRIGGGRSSAHRPQRGGVSRPPRRRPPEGRRGLGRDTDPARCAAICRTRASTMTTRLSRSGSATPARNAPASAAPHDPDQQRSLGEAARRSMNTVRAGMLPGAVAREGTPMASRLAVLALASVAVFAATLVALHLLRADVSPLSQGISHYGNGSYRWILPIANGVLGVGDSPWCSAWPSESRQRAGR